MEARGDDKRVMENGCVERGEGISSKRVHLKMSGLGANGLWLWFHESAEKQYRPD